MMEYLFIILWVVAFVQGIIHNILLFYIARKEKIINSFSDFILMPKELNTLIYRIFFSNVHVVGDKLKTIFIFNLITFLIIFTFLFILFFLE